MTRKKTGVKWRIFGSFMAFGILMLVLLWVLQTVFLDQFYSAVKLYQVQQQADAIASAVAEDDDSWRRNVQGRGDLNAELYIPSAEDDGETVIPDFPERIFSRLTQQEKKDLYQETLQNGGKLTRLYSIEPTGPSGPLHVSERRSVVAARLLEKPDGTEVLLIVSSDLTPVQATVQTLQVQLVCVSIIMLLLAFGAAVLLSRKIAQPIEGLNQSARKLAGGQFKAPPSAGAYREVTELSETLSHAAAELSKTEALRRELIANVSHDLRTPLTLIAGYSEMMRDIPEENTPENIQVVIDESRRLSSLVADLLDLSQLQSGTVRMKNDLFSITAEVRSIVLRVSKLSEAEGHSFHFESDSEVQVHGDATRIGQVVYNFLLNAMVHGGEGKSITVRQQIQQNWVRIEVCDEGGGIASDELPHIWERYHKSGGNGSGLGLSITQSILQQHPGAKFGVETALGTGSTFWFSLPLAT
ncbi:MAG: sensor histidine kinase [Oscillospiraceae bacterium]